MLIFASYARGDMGLAVDFLERLRANTALSKRFTYTFWRDQEEVLMGEDWDQTIKQALAESDAGLLLLSKHFLNRDYITKVELPILQSKAVLPVLLEPLDSKRHDLHDLERLQFFQFYPNNKSPRALTYEDCTTSRLRNQFADACFEAIERRLTQ